MVMLHQVKRQNPLRKKRRIARGGKKGVTSGRGTKGQKSRAGHKIRPAIRETLKKFPKKRGYRMRRAMHEALATVNLYQLDKAFSANEIVTPKTLRTKGLVSRVGGKLPGVKILSEGELSKKLTIQGCEVSKSAKAKLEKNGSLIK